jgi:hypothetical protein
MRFTISCVALLQEKRYLAQKYLKGVKNQQNNFITRNAHTKDAYMYSSNTALTDTHSSHYKKFTGEMGVRANVWYQSPASVHNVGVKMSGRTTTHHIPQPPYNILYSTYQWTTFLSRAYRITFCPWFGRCEDLWC